MKTFLTIAVVGVGAYGLWYWYQKSQQSAAQQRLTAGSNQAGGTSIFNEPNMEPQPSIAFA